MDEPARAPMMRRFGGLKGYAITTTEGDVGTFEDFLFDETSWTVRQLVVDTGSWLSGRRVLLSPRSIAGIEDVGRRMMTDLTRRQLEGSPDIDAARPVSRRHEIELAAYYGYPFYWTGPYRWGTSPGPMPFGIESPPRAAGAAADARPSRVEPELHSATDVIGYGIAAADGELGHVEDYLVDEESWAIRYLIVDPRNWWPNAHVIVGVEWFTDVSWERRTVGVDMTRDAVRKAPEWRPEQSVERDWETRLHRHHGRPGYWERPADRWLVYPYAA
jgi:sporulation protein YlmC with PRC-barrel domain